MQMTSVRLLPAHAHLNNRNLAFKMAAAMDVDTPSGANNSAGKKRFEVKKVGEAFGAYSRGYHTP